VVICPQIITLPPELGAYMNHRIFTTATGVEIPLKPISVRTLDDLTLGWEKVLAIKPPKYTVEIVGGETQEMEHDESTLNTDEDRAAWAAYIAELNAAIVKHNEASIKVLVTFGIELNPPDDGWESDFEFCGIPVPEQAAERKVFYCQRVLLTDPADEQKIVRQIQNISRLSGEALDRADALFRNTVSDERGMDTAGGSADQSGEVATQ